jgi:hypothetical protein
VFLTLASITLVTVTSILACVFFSAANYKEKAVTLRADNRTYIDASFFVQKKNMSVARELGVFKKYGVRSYGP